MNRIDPYLLVRAASLYLPIVLGGIACLARRPGPLERIAAFMAFAWSAPSLLALHVFAIGAGWWRFDADGGLFLAMPVDLWLSWTLLWGPVMAIAFPAAPLAVVAGAALMFDLALMPAAFPVVRLGDNWLIGEAVALTTCLVPAQLLARWTATDRRLIPRAILQVIAFSALLVWLVPAIAIETSGSNWHDPFAEPMWVLSLTVQALALPAILGLTAVQEFVTRGSGTPIPFDPPKRLVTTGPYAYVANPMQLSAALLLLMIAAIVANWWIAAAAVIALAYSGGLATWHEGEDLRERFGETWALYRSHVRTWIPRFRPWYRDAEPVATLYVAENCGMCQEVASWYRSRGVCGLSIVAAEDHPRGGLTRITYESNDGTCQATGTNAIARALEHVHLGWAFAGFAMRLPVVATFVQLIVDASGGEPRAVEPRATSARRTGS